MSKLGKKPIHIPKETKVKIETGKFIVEGKNYYHHVGIYSFRYEILKKFVSLLPSENEQKRKLEQMRALDSGMSIGVGYVKNVPISVDTKEDLLKIIEKMQSL